jgi:hypothetical protein
MALFSPAFDRSGLAAETVNPVNTAWDLAWIDQMSGKHKQVFDLGGRKLDDTDAVAGDSPLRVPKNYLNAHKEVYGLESPAINTIVGITSQAFPINATDALWVKYSLGEKWKIKDSKTGTWAVRNLFADASVPFGDQALTVQALQKRGTVFWQCNNALGGVARMLAGQMKMDFDTVRSELVAGLLPGVKLVPAHTMAIGLVQEKGCTYEKV